MKLRWLTILLALAPFSASAHAQIGVYGAFNSVRLTASIVGSSAQTTAWYSGAGAGVYYNFVKMGPIALGADLRGNLLSGNQQKYRSALFGLRLAAKPPVLPIRPYVQASIGAGGASHSGLNGVGTIYSDKFQYLVAGGVEYTVVPHVDFRVVEVGYGRMTGISSGGTAPVATLFSISSGLVLRFP
ncbi:MAG: hypothetical protein WCA21_20300 [Terracidiphilus sp.]